MCFGPVPWKHGPVVRLARPQQGEFGGIYPPLLRIIAGGLQRLQGPGLEHAIVVPESSIREVQEFPAIALF
jgi:hypothetical protein